MEEVKKSSVKVTENISETAIQAEDQDGQKMQLEKFKKPIIFFLMAIVCAGCMYLIFKPGEDKTLTDQAGFNSEVPQAANDKLQSDKQKAYEQQLLEQKNTEKRNALTSLSDYWNDSISANSSKDAVGSIEDANSNSGIGGEQNAVNSYRKAQQTIGSFYKRDDQEVEKLRREINRLKNEASRPDQSSTSSNINDQLELMEKSYQMAAKYLPTANNKSEVETIDTSENVKDTEKVKPESAYALHENVVSRIYRESEESLMVEDQGQTRFSGMANQLESGSQNKNAIRAIISETRQLMEESIISIKLVEPMMLGKTVISSGTVVKAYAKFQSGRLQLKISNIEHKGSIIPVELTIYDNDGQPGLYVPYSSEKSAVNDIVGSMGQTSGTNIMMTQSASQQLAADLTKGVVQGVSGYFQKKVRLPKVTVKAGHQVYLVSKK